MLHGRDKGLGHRDVSIMAGKVTSLKEQLVAEVLQGAQVGCCVQQLLSGHGLGW